MIRHPGPTFTALFLLVLAPAGAAYGHGFADEQVEQLDLRIAAGPERAALYIERAEIHRQAGQLEEARHDLAHARRLSPDAPGLSLVQAAVELDTDRPGDAVALLTPYLAAYPEEGQGWLLRARARARLKQHAQAAADYDAAIDRLDAPRPDHFMERLAEHLAMDDVPLALKGLAEGRRRLGHVIALERAGLDLEVKMQDYDAALARLDAIRPEFQMPALWLEWRGGILRRAGREMEALATYSQALAAIEALPENRRTSMASRTLETRLRDALHTKEASR